MKVFTAIVTLASLAFASAQTMPPVTNCATSPDLTIDTFTLAPYPLCIGEQVCATGTGLLSTPVIAPAALNIVGKYFGQTVYTDNHDLCALLATQGHPCPIPVTLTSITACVMVKNTAPADIPVVLTVSATNGNGNTLFCQKASGVIAKKCT